MVRSVLPMILLCVMHTIQSLRFRIDSNGFVTMSKCSSQSHRVEMCGDVLETANNKRKTCAQIIVFWFDGVCVRRKLFAKGVSVYVTAQPLQPSELSASARIINSFTKLFSYISAFHWWCQKNVSIAFKHDNEQRAHIRGWMESARTHAAWQRKEEKKHEMGMCHKGEKRWRAHSKNEIWSWKIFIFWFLFSEKLSSLIDYPFRLPISDVWFHS